MKYIVTLLLFFCFLLIAFIGCMDSNEEIAPDNEKKFSVHDAQEYFDQNATDLNALSLFSPNENKTRSGELPTTILTPAWKEAAAYGYDSIKIIDIPIRSNTLTMVFRHDRAPETPERKFNSLVQSKLVIANMADETVRMFIATLIPDFEELFNFGFMHTTSYFSGLVFFSELDGTFGEVWEYRKGIRGRKLNVTPLSQLSGEEREGVEEYARLQPMVFLRKQATRSESEVGVYDPSCPFCIIGTCITHKTHYLDEISVYAPNPSALYDCPYCGSTTHFVGDCLSYPPP